MQKNTDKELADYGDEDIRRWGSEEEPKKIYGKMTFG